MKQNPKIPNFWKKDLPRFKKYFINWSVAKGKDPAHAIHNLSEKFL